MGRIGRNVRRKQKGSEVRKVLASLYPQVFMPEGEIDIPKIPLKVGIHKDILERHGDILTQGQVRQALYDYTRGPRYLRALASSAYRYDLDGSPSGEVEPSERRLAEDALERSRRRWAEKHWAHDLVPDPEEMHLMDMLVSMTEVPLRNPQIKLILCVFCGDIRSLHYKPVTCRCGRCGGRFTSAFHAEVWGSGYVRVLGVDEGTLHNVLIAQRDLGDLEETVLTPEGEEPKGRRFLAYVVPDAAVSVTIADAQPEGD